MALQSLAYTLVDCKSNGFRLTAQYYVTEDMLGLNANQKAPQKYTYVIQTFDFMSAYSKLHAVAHT